MPQHSTLGASSAKRVSRKPARPALPSRIALSSRGQEALAYAINGLAVLPLHTIRYGSCTCGNPQCGSPGKHPGYVAGYFEKGATDASSEPRRIRAAFRKLPDANVGIHVGKSHLVVIDVDPRNGGDDSMHELVRLLGDGVLDTVTADTGGGGKHYFYIDPGVPLQAKPLPGIDVKQGNGYVVAPPSVHKSGAQYAWSADKGILERTPAEMPTELLAVLRSPIAREDPDLPVAQALPELDAIRQQCSFVDHAVVDAAKLSEPHWYAFISIAARTAGGEEAVHTASSSHPDYSPDETDRKIEHAVEASKPITCAYIESKLAWPGCKACPVRGRVNSPIGLGRPVGGRAGISRIAIDNREIPDISRDLWREIRNHPEVGVVARQGDRLIWVPTDAGEATVRPVDRDALASLIYRTADTVNSLDTGKPAYPAVRVLNDMLKMPPPDLPEFVGFSSSPFVRSDGRIVDKPGFDENSGFFLLPDPLLSSIIIPETPTADDVMAAKTVIEDIVADFPFRTDSDQANAIAMLLTPFVRTLFDSVTPLFAITAPSQGQGKSILAQVVARIQMGDGVAFTGWPRNDEELRKHLLALLAAGQPWVVFDNAEGTIHSIALATILTSDRYEDRVLGTSTVMRARQRLNWIITGNNLEFSGDIPRRVVPVRLDANVSNVSGRIFRHTDLVGHAMTHRSAIVSALLTLYQYWKSSGSPEGSRGLPSFGRWASVVGGILECAGYTAFLEHRSDVIQERDRWAEMNNAFVQFWWNRFDSFDVTAAELARAAEDGMVNPLSKDFNETGYNRSLGHWLSRNQDRHFGPFAIRRSMTPHHSGQVQYHLEQTAP